MTFLLRESSNDISYRSSFTLSFLQRTAMANSAFSALVVAASAPGPAVDNVAAMDADACSTVSDASSIFHEATDERANLARS